MIGIAAMQAGALAVTAVEIDPMAVAAIELNTELNQVKLNAAVDNLIGQDLNGYDLVLAGDICYEKKMTDAVLSWLQPMVNLGKTVLLGDPGRTYLPSQGLHRHAQYTIPTTLELEAKNTLSTGVLQLLPSSSISG